MLASTGLPLSSLHFKHVFSQKILFQGQAQKEASPFPTPFAKKQQSLPFLNTFLKLRSLSGAHGTSVFQWDTAFLKMWPSQISVTAKTLLPLLQTESNRYDTLLQIFFFAAIKVQWLKHPYRGWFSWDRFSPLW